MVLDVVDKCRSVVLGLQRRSWPKDMRQMLIAQILIVDAEEPKDEINEGCKHAKWSTLSEVETWRSAEKGHLMHAGSRTGILQWQAS